MSFGVETYVDGVACTYTGAPYNLLSMVRITDLKAGTHQLPIASLGAGTIVPVSREYDFNHWGFNPPASSDQQIWSLGDGSNSKGYMLESCTYSGGYLVVKIAAVPNNAWLTGAKQFSIDVFIKRS